MRDFPNGGTSRVLFPPIGEPLVTGPSEDTGEAGVLVVLWCCMVRTGGAVPRTRALAVLSTVNNVDSIRQGYIS
jgi:hypothetical protein